MTADINVNKVCEVPTPTTNLRPVDLVAKRVRGELPTDWLKQVDGLTVAGAIDYLSSLDPSHVLSYDLDGDTHGVSVTSYLTYDRLETPRELRDRQVIFLRNEIRFWETALARNRQRLELEVGTEQLRMSAASRVESNLEKLASLRAELAALESE